MNLVRTVTLTPELLAFLEAKVAKLQAGQPPARKAKITVETVLVGYAELGRQHDSIVSDLLREKQVTKTA